LRAIVSSHPTGDTPLELQPADAAQRAFPHVAGEVLGQLDVAASQPQVLVDLVVVPVVERAERLDVSGLRSLDQPP
jgi:hypothetical protein